jgi:hypothetical protein
MKRLSPMQRGYMMGLRRARARAQRELNDQADRFENVCALTSSLQRRRRGRACNASTTSEIMLRSALFMTERISQARPPTTRWGKITAYVGSVFIRMR